jgi:hypothetical protein
MRVLSALVLGLGVVVASVASQAPETPTSKPRPMQDLVLREAVRQKDVRAVVSRLASGGDARARESGGRTVLMDAVALGEAEVVRALLRGGADSAAATSSGWTALHEAVANRQTESLRVLLEAGAPADARDRMEGTPLDLAERGGEAELGRLLRERGARGSGKSVGDTVCVRPWSGEGYGGVVIDRAGPTYRLRVTETMGCRSGCTGTLECLGGKSLEELTAGVVVEVPGSCLTHTGLARGRGAQ